MKPRTLRIAAVVAQPTLLALAVLAHGTAHALLVGASVLVALWAVLAAVVGARAAARRHAGSALDAVDVLTASGATTVWLGVGALFLSAWIGWASLAVIGVLGIGVVDLAAIWVALAAGGERPWRRATIARAIVPAIATAGEPIREELRVASVAIPAGTRLFAAGRAAPHLPITRYAIGAEGAGAELRLGSELGPAPRGEHAAPPLALWLGDVLGLARTAIHHAGATTFTVLPSYAAIEGAHALVGGGGDDDTTAPATRLPTEGTFRLREYVPGDDTRRIHWVRSLNATAGGAANLVVRLPDELPDADPVVRLVLDTELPGAEALTTRAPDDLLDALVRVWLAAGKALADGGARVILATAARDRATGALRIVERPVHARSREPLALGARVTWQTEVATTAVIAHASPQLAKPPRQIIVSCRPRALAGEAAPTWLVVPERAWTVEEPALPRTSPLVLAFPIGSEDNRLGRRRRERQRIEVMHQERAYFSQVACAIDWSVASGSFLARPRGVGRIELAVIQ